MTRDKSGEQFVDGWHFLPSDCRLTHDDGRSVVVGETLGIPEDKYPRPREYGMHACVDASDALIHAAGLILCRVRLTGDIVNDNEVYCARNRTVLAMADATETLIRFAEECISLVPDGFLIRDHLRGIIEGSGWYHDLPLSTRVSDIRCDAYIEKLGGPSRQEYNRERSMRLAAMFNELLGLTEESI